MNSPKTKTRATLIPGAVLELPRSGSGAFSPRSFNFLVRTYDIPGGVEQLRRNGRDGTWMSFLFTAVPPSPFAEDKSLALQYSIEEGKVGLDWVLLAPRAIADRDLVLTFMESLGHSVRERKRNGVKYLRVEDGDLGALGRAVTEELYGASERAELGLVIDGLMFATGRQGVN